MYGFIKRMKTINSCLRLNEYMDKEEKFKLLIALKKVEPLTKWDDIKEGEVYHIPPLAYNKRRDFEVIQKTNNNIMRVKFLDRDNFSTIYRTDTTSNFIVKKMI